MRRTPDYEWLEHTADIRIRVRGVDEAALHESAALAMAELMVERPTDGVAEREVALTVPGSTPEDRLMELLRELLFRFDVEAELPVAAHVSVAPDGLEYRGRAVLFDAATHEGLREIKAVTWHELEVVASDAGWRADIVFDV